MLKSILFVFALCLVAAVPADNVNDRREWTAWQEIGALSNCNGASLNASVTCGDIRTQGYNALTLEIRYTRDAGSGWQCYLETCREGFGAAHCAAATSWHRVAVLHPSPAGVALYPEPIFRNVSANDQVTLTIGINYLRVRLGSCTGKGSPSADDKLYVYARLGYLQNI